MPLLAPKATPPKSADLSPFWFWIGLFGIVGVSFVLRFWGLSRFNTLVFDEVYYAKFASEFLRREIVFTGHPPLSTYIIAFGIWVSNALSWGDDIKNGLTGLLLSPFSYRWLNAFTGALLPLVIASIAYLLSNRRSYALIAAFLLAVDGLFLVESRYALNNIYLVLFGLLGQVGFLLALRTQLSARWFWLIFAGASFGASAAIKWNGLGFLFGAYLVWGAGWIISMLQTLRSPVPSRDRHLVSPFPLHNLTQIHLGHILVAFVLTPALTYFLCWIPYILVDASPDNFWQLQLKTFDYHQRVGGLNAHPYCSLWFTWPLMIRPIAYFYKVASGASEPVPVVGPPQPQGGGEVIYDVHAMGNPLLWWFAAAAILLFIGLLIQQGWQWLTAPRTSSAEASGQSIVRPLLNGQTWIALYIVLNWVANLLPWVKVQRCVFLYHYMESLVFSLLALALILDRWLHSYHPSRRAMGITVLFLTLIAFIFWMPLYLGLPLTPEALQLRRWFPSWI